jgi:hypothetical protein
LAVIQILFSSQIKDAIIHSAGFVNLSTDEEQREKILDGKYQNHKNPFSIYFILYKKVYLLTLNCFFIQTQKD